ncbi:uncharacterized protein LOC113340864 [Papaver somniferum]|uniref:uncharacterized protein LOC113340864 n=1 Tax=Papaver somniferum TaxID=3469 RepID=UPI000E7053F3|nr:uncharacterized protein LOC113340864 [Papaver somniferum]
MEESTFHLFFECDYAKKIWSLPSMATQGVSLNLINAKTFLEHYNDWQAGKLDPISMDLAATKCWFIWKERCLRVFENKTRTAEQLAIAISRHFVYWHPDNRHNNNRLHKTEHSMNIFWQLPPEHTLKLNCDASWISEITNAGVGFVIRNSTCTFTTSEYGYCRTLSAEETEAVALLRATQWANRHNIQNLMIEGDNQATISYLQGKTNSYVDKRANKVADLLAKEGRRSNSTAFWTNQPPSFLFPAITFDTVKAYDVCATNNVSVVSFSAGINQPNSVIGRATHRELVSEESELAD